jgi:hypothetical protein
MEVMRNKYRISARKAEEEISRRRTRWRWEVNGTLDLR